MLADHAGLAREHLSELENGHKEVGVRMLERIATALDTKLSQFSRIFETEPVTIRTSRNRVSTHHWDATPGRELQLQTPDTLNIASQPTTARSIRPRCRVTRKRVRLVPGT
jgi:transcriptional regulator with XRE-family HTH domain